MRLLVPMARRRGRILGSQSRDASSSSEPLKSASRDIEGEISKELSIESHPIVGKALEIPYETPDKPSTDLKRKPKGIIRLIKYLPGRISSFWQMLFPPPTEEELEGKEELRKLNSRTKLVKKECRIYARKISDTLSNLGEKEILLSAGTDKPKRRIKKPKFEMGTWDQLFTKIILSLRTDAKYVPSNMSISELALDPKFSLDLSPSLHHDVKWVCDNSGVRVTIFRHGRDGLPDYIDTDTMWARVTDNKSPFTIPVGFGDNSAAHWLDPSEYPHLLVSGGTGWGKSNFVNQLLCFWLWRGLTPQDLQLVLFDLKRGMEFSFYENLPHLYKDDVIKTGIIEDLDGVMPALVRLQEVLDHRLELIKTKGFKSLQEYNWAAKPEDRLPTIFIVIDEWAKIRLSRSGLGQSAVMEKINQMIRDEVEDILRKGLGTNYVKLSEILSEFTKRVLKIRQSRHFGLEAEQKLSDFCSISRAAGIFVILSTQHPSKEVIGPLILTNFPSRIVFNCSVGGSMAALRTQSAFGLQYKGRAILQDSGIETLLQTPMISTSDINGIVYKVITGEPMKLGKMGIGMQEILIYSLHNLNGMLDILTLYDTFRTKGIRKEWLRNNLKAIESREVTLSGVLYKVLPRGKYNPRRLQRI